MIVIFKDIYGYKTTTEENYNRMIWNASEIQKWKGFTSPQQIIEYSCKYFKTKPEDFKVIE